MISKKQIISDKDFGKIHFVVRRSARNITMRVKEDGLHVTTPPYRSITALLEAIAPFRERLRNVCSEVKPKPFDLNFSIEAECFRLKLETSPLKNFTVSMLHACLVNHLGLPVECLPYPDRASEASPLLDIIWRGGNFGQYNAGNLRPMVPSWKRKWQTACAFRRNMGFAFRYAPKESFWIVSSLLKGQFK